MTLEKRVPSRRLVGKGGGGRGREVGGASAAIALQNQAPGDAEGGREGGRDGTGQSWARRQKGEMRAGEKRG